MRFTNFLLVLAVYIYRPLRGSAKRPPKTLDRVLVVQTAKLGDMVCSTPVLRALRTHAPQAHITVLGDAVGKELLAGHTAVDNYIVSKTGFFALLKLVRHGRFDAAMVLVPDSRALALALLGGAHFVAAPQVVDGFCPWMTRTYRVLCRLVHTEPHRMGHYAPQEYLNMLRLLGITSEDTSKELFVTAQAEVMVETMLAPYPQQLKVAIAPGAGNKIKEWPPERFNEVAKYLVAQRAAFIVIVGGPTDIELAKIVAKDLPQGSVLDTAGKLSIEELKALVKRMSLFVSADTGPIYIAEAFNIPTVDIVGPMDEEEQPPMGPCHKAVVAPRQKPELHIMNARVYNAREARRQVEEITVSMVVAAVEDALPRAHTPPRNKE